MLGNPHESGFTTFVLGVLFVLSVYHFLLYFQNKDKVYLFYSLYTFLILLNQTKFVFIDSNSISINTYKSVLSNFHSPIVWIYNTFYFIFGFTFLNLKIYSKKWYTFIFTIVRLFLIVIFIAVFSFLITGNIKYIHIGNDLIIPCLYLFGVIAYYSLFSIKMPLKSYIIVGSFVLYISSFLAEYLDSLITISPNNNITTSIFYIGVIIENLIFSLGLGYKQKLILNERNEVQIKLIKKLKEEERYDKELIELKMASLRTQMNPHFIFNSLNAIKLYIINNEKENAVYYLNKFSKLIRKILATTQEKDISLGEEIETMELYLNIENIRFNNEIKYQFNIDQDLNLNTIKIPTLIFQPFIENAIWHGLSLKKKDKKITINIKQETKNFVLIQIIDNGIGRKKALEIKKQKTLKKNSIGIKLTEERLTHFFKNYENNYTLLFKDLIDDNGEPIGTEVNLKIPIK